MKEEICIRIHLLKHKPKRIDWMCATKKTYNIMLQHKTLISNLILS